MFNQTSYRLFLLTALLFTVTFALSFSSEQKAENSASALYAQDYEQ
jgi:hypothetical protein